ncbi:MAG: hypothetical protein ACLRWQ_01600 [Flavonifractor plautii]
MKKRRPCHCSWPGRMMSVGLAACGNSGDEGSANTAETGSAETTPR